MEDQKLNLSNIEINLLKELDFKLFPTYIFLVKSIEKLNCTIQSSENLLSKGIFFVDFNGDLFLISLKFIESPSTITVDTETVEKLINYAKIKEVNLDNTYFIFLSKTLPKKYEENKQKFSIRDVLYHTNVNSILNNSKQSMITHNQNNNSIIIVQKNQLKKGLPISRIKENPLNELNSREWLQFTKTWFILNPKRRLKDEIQHPAKYPEELVQRYIKFFTKTGDKVFDPFLGVGSTIVAALDMNRSGIGIELNKKYYEIAKQRCDNTKKSRQFSIDSFLGKDNDEIGNYKNNVTEVFFRIFNDDSKNIKKIWDRNSLPLIDFCMTSPPYWNQLKRNSLRQNSRVENGLDSIYSDNNDDIGNIDDYNDFLISQQEIFHNVFEIMKQGKYLVVVTNNIYSDGRVYPLAFDTVSSLSKIGWIPMDEQIWLQNDKALLPLGLFSKYLGNRCHQYCLIFYKN